MSRRHHAQAVDIVGTVAKFRPGAGFMGCDLADVQYEHPHSGEVHTMPFATNHVRPGEPRFLHQLAERYAALADELRHLAGEPR